MTSKLRSKPTKQEATAQTTKQKPRHALKSTTEATEARKIKMIREEIAAIASRETTSRRAPNSKQAFRRKNLETAFVAYCQAIFAEGFAKLELTFPMSEPIELIANEKFRSAKADSEILGDRLFGTSVSETTSKTSKVPDLPVHLARLCETKLLKPVEERELFQRMNYLRFKAEKSRQMAIATGPHKATQQQIQRTIALAKIADWYRDAIVKANMRLVISIVKKFVNANNAFDDLLSDGIVALMRAVDKFDFDRGFRFSTYATQVVRRNSYRNVMTKQKERLQISNNVHESSMDVSDELREPTMSEARWHLLRSRLALMLDGLDRREKLIIRARFSLGSHRNVKTLQRLADRLGVSKERVRQLEKRSLDKLRDMVEADPLVENENDTI